MICRGIFSYDLKKYDNLKSILVHFSFNFVCMFCVAVDICLL